MVVGDVAGGTELEHAQPLDGLGALRDHDEVGERVDVVEADVGAVGEDLGPRRPSR